MTTERNRPENEEPRSRPLVVANVERVTADAARQMSESVLVRGCMIGTGFFMSSGRHIAIKVEATALPDRVRVSDAGELWSDLVFAGFDRPKPSRANTARLQRLARAHGLEWDGGTFSIVAVVPLSDVADAARRIVAVGLGLDAWLWFSPTNEPEDKVAQRVTQVLQRASAERGWHLVDQPVPGKFKPWKVTARVEIGLRTAAVNTMVDEPEEAIEDRTLGFLNDTQEPLVVVTGPAKAWSLRNSPAFHHTMFKDRTRVVALRRDPNDRGEEIVTALDGVAGWR